MFQVGQPVEITGTESRLLGELANVMASAQRHQRTGWFRIYLEAHRESHKLISAIFKRSHAN